MKKIIKVVFTIKRDPGLEGSLQFSGNYQNLSWCRYMFILLQFIKCGTIHNCAIFFFWTLINENDIKIIEAAKDLTVSQSELVLREPCPVLWDSLRISSGQKGINSVNSKKFGK